MLPVFCPAGASHSTTQYCHIYTHDVRCVVLPCGTVTSKNPWVMQILTCVTPPESCTVHHIDASYINFEIIIMSIYGILWWLIIWMHDSIIYLLFLCFIFYISVFYILHFQTKRKKDGLHSEPIIWGILLLSEPHNCIVSIV